MTSSKAKRIGILGLWLTSCAALACSGGGKEAVGGGAGASEARARAAALDARIAALSYDPVALLSAQPLATGDVQRTQVGTATASTRPDGNALVACTTTTYDLRQNAEEVAILRPTNGIVWPGALVKGNATLLAGAPEPFTVEPAPITLRVDLPGIGDHGTLAVARPSHSSVQGAIDGALAWWNDHAYQQGYVNPSSSSYRVSTAYGSQQVALDLGLNVSWASADVGAQFAYTSSDTSSVGMMLFKQVFYTVTLDTPATPAAMLGPTVDGESLAPLLDPAAPPAYVHSVSYGRLILFRMETSEAVKAADLKAAMTYAAGVVPVSGSLEVAYKNLLARSTMTVVTIGGNAEAAAEAVEAKSLGDLAPILTGKNALYSKENPGVPIAYTVRFLKDNTLAKMGYATEYAVNECQRLAPATATVRNSGGAYTARALLRYVDHTTKQPVEERADNITVGTQHDFVVPAGATEVELGADELWGFGWTPVFHLTWPAVTRDVRVCLHGTTLSPGWDRCGEVDPL